MIELTVILCLVGAGVAALVVFIVGSFVYEGLKDDYMYDMGALSMEDELRTYD